MALKVQIRMVEGTTVIEFQGVGCTELLQLLVDDLDVALEGERRVVIDLNDATLTDAEHVKDLVTAMASMAPQVSVVCRRLTARRLLRSTPSSDRVTVYPTLADALRRPWTDPGSTPPDTAPPFTPLEGPAA